MPQKPSWIRDLVLLVPVEHLVALLIITIWTCQFRSSQQSFTILIHLIRPGLFHFMMDFQVVFYMFHICSINWHTDDALVFWGERWGDGSSGARAMRGRWGANSSFLSIFACHPFPLPLWPFASKLLLALCLCNYFRWFCQLSVSFCSVVIINTNPTNLRLNLQHHIAFRGSFRLLIYSFINDF